ncbi:MAG: hypothetical protein WC867_00770 [Candidatus Pacearchaeota archaeon]|jgi:hypothetical protein
MGNEEIIITKLDELKQEIDFIKSHLLDVTLTQEDIESLYEADEDLKKGRTKRL